MPLNQFISGQSLEEAQYVFDTFTTFNRGMKSGRTAFGAPTVATGVGAGTAGGAVIGTVTGSDFAANFTVTAGTTPAVGTLATVTYGTPLGAFPSGVIVNVSDNAGTALTTGAGSLTANGFSIVTTQSPTLNHVYTVNYLVIQ